MCTHAYIEKEEVVSELASRYSNILYTTPESAAALFGDNGVDIQHRVSFIAFDECHSITEASVLFRPEYAYGCEKLISLLSHPTVIAVTASCTPTERKIISERLGFKDIGFSKEFVSDSWTDRPGVQYQWIETQQTSAMKDILDKLICPAIIYVTTRKQAELVSYYLRDNNISCDYYHGNRNRRERRELQALFLDDKIDCLVATNAFGLGVNKQNIKTIIHYGFPTSIQRYYQETGRIYRRSSDTNVSNNIIGKPHYSFSKVDRVNKHTGLIVEVCNAPNFTSGALGSWSGADADL